jgi:hypothetical protein
MRTSGVLCFVTWMESLLIRTSTICPHRRMLLHIHLCQIADSFSSVETRTMTEKQVVALLGDLAISTVPGMTEKLWSDGMADSSVSDHQPCGW